jgi:hypothetical protein
MLVQNFFKTSGYSITKICAKIFSSIIDPKNTAVHYLSMYTLKNAFKHKDLNKLFACMQILWVDFFRIVFVPQRIWRGLILRIYFYLTCKYVWRNKEYMWLLTTNLEEFCMNNWEIPKYINRRTYSHSLLLGRNKRFVKKSTLFFIGSKGNSIFVNVGSI